MGWLFYGCPTWDRTAERDPRHPQNRRSPLIAAALAPRPQKLQTRRLRQVAKGAVAHHRHGGDGGVQGALEVDEVKSSQTWHVYTIRTLIERDIGYKNYVGTPAPRKTASSGFCRADKIFSATFSISFAPQKGSLTS